MLKKLLLAVSLLCIISTPLLSQDLPDIKKSGKTAINLIASQIKSFPQEKIYLHFDKPYYSAGERIWFRVYLVHSAVHIPYELSRYVYVELVNAGNEVVLRKKIRPLESMYYGQMDLSPDLTEGWYSLQAYTSYMRNAGEAYFFRRQVYIGNNLKEQEKAKTESEVKVKKTTPDKTSPDNQPYTVAFYPEGNHLVAGNMQIIGIKATTPEGNELEVTGRILDEEKAEVTSFGNTTNGLGIMALVPLGGKTYTAVCEDVQGRKITISLPPVSESDYALAIQQNASVVMVSLNTPNQLPAADTLFLLVHQRGAPVYQALFIPGNNVISFSKKGLSSGIIQLLLLNRFNEVLSDRQLFITNPDQVSVTMTTDKANYKKRDLVKVTVNLKDATSQPVAGNFSVSVTDDADVKINPDDETIESRLLLQSEFREPVSKPNRYFHANDKQAQAQLDWLMLTSKWDRYNIPSVVTGQLAKGDAFVLERGSIITGKVVSFPSKRGIPGNNVSMFVQNPRHADASTTDKDGRFYFEGFEFPDSTKVMLQAQKGAGSFIDLIPDKDSFPAVNLILPPVSSLSQQADLKNYLKKSREKYIQENGMLSINLREVEVVAKKQKDEKLIQLRKDRGAVYFSPSRSFTAEDIEMAPTLIDLLTQVAGITATSDNTGILIRNGTPAIIVDNIKRDMDELTLIQPSEVELIDVLKDPGDLALWGNQYGAVCIYLKRGEALKEKQELGTHQALITPLGYCTPQEFPTPAYQIPENRMNGIPDLRSTLYWKPNVVCDENGQASFSFYMADNQGSCTVIIEGVSAVGDIIRFQGKINAK